MTAADWLDNPVWSALTTRQADLARGDELARGFEPEVSVLAGLRSPAAECFRSLARVVRPGAAVGVLLEAPQPPPAGWEPVQQTPLLQMWRDLPSPMDVAPPADLLDLTDRDAAEMLALAQLTRPGPFGRRSHTLGRFVGVRRGGVLAAMAGERLRVPGCVEVSAVCTHPDYTGQGLGAGLLGEVVRRILARGELPFLHVRDDNARAVDLYRRSGFRVRARPQLLVIRRPAGPAVSGDS